MASDGLSSALEVALLGLAGGWCHAAAQNDENVPSSWLEQPLDPVLLPERRTGRKGGEQVREAELRPNLGKSEAHLAFRRGHGVCRAWALEPSPAGWRGGWLSLRRAVGSPWL